MQARAGLILVTLQATFFEPMVRHSDAGALDRCALRGHPFPDQGRWMMVTIR
jgi:hypothetical protein